MIERSQMKLIGAATALLCIALLTINGCYKRITPNNENADKELPGTGLTQACCEGDEFAPWAGGAQYYKQWSNGPRSDKDYFPIAVWLQTPSNAKRYQALGINQFIGLWKGPTERQLQRLAETKMPVMASQNEVGLNNKEGNTINGWTQQDEPDNAQPNGRGGYGPCVATSEIQSRYDAMRSADPSRPVYLNLGQGVANDRWIGRGECHGQDKDYPEYAAAADIVSFDIYPVTSKSDYVAGNLWFVAKGVRRLRAWVNSEKPVWVWLETTHTNNPKVRPTPYQIKAEVWMAIINGAMGIGYFSHEFQPAFIEAGLLAYPDVSAAVGAINDQIKNLAQVLNSPTVTNGVAVTSSNNEVPIATMLKRHGHETYLFAVAMRGMDTTAQFTLSRIHQDAPVAVLKEKRQLHLMGGKFSDDFKGYAVHIYRIRIQDNAG